MHYIVGTLHNDGKATVQAEAIGDDGKPTGDVKNDARLPVTGFLGVDVSGHLVLAETEDDLPAPFGAERIQKKPKK